MSFEIDIDLTGSKKIGRYDMKRFKKAVEIGTKNGIDEMSEKTVNKVHSNLSKYGLEDSELANSIELDKNDTSCNIVINANEYAQYVEYGTGIVGSENPHPKPDGWSYDVNNHGEAGWWYPTDGSDGNPSKYETKSGDMLAHTRGMPSRPFMYDTWRWAKLVATKIINKNIRQEIERWLK